MEDNKLLRFWMQEIFWSAEVKKAQDVDVT